MAREKKRIGSYVRFTFTPEETKLFDEACKLDERSRPDFARLACLRAIHSVIAQFGQSEVFSTIKQALDAEKAQAEGNKS